MRLRLTIAPEREALAPVAKREKFRLAQRKGMGEPALLERLDMRLFGVPVPEESERLRNRLQALPGVVSASVGFLRQVASVAYEPAVTDATVIREAVRAAGYEAALPPPISGGDLAPGTSLRAGVTDWVALVASLLAMACVPASSFLGYGSGTLAGILRELPMLLSGLAVVLLGGRLGPVVPRELARWTLSLPSFLLLVSIVSLVWAAFDHLIYGANHLDVPAGIVLFALAWSWLSGAAKEAITVPQDRLCSFLPERATVVRDSRLFSIPINDLRGGDPVLVSLGGRVPADGVVTEGSGLLAGSYPLGESVEIREGSTVLAGSLLSRGEILIRPVAWDQKATVRKETRDVLAAARLAPLPADRLRQWLEHRGALLSLLLGVVGGLVSLWWAKGSDATFSLAVGLLLSLPFSGFLAIRDLVFLKGAGELLLGRFLVYHPVRLLTSWRRPAFVVIEAGEASEADAQRLFSSLKKPWRRLRLVVVDASTAGVVRSTGSVVRVHDFEAARDWIRSQVKRARRFVVITCVPLVAQVDFPNADVIVAHAQWSQNLDTELVARGIGRSLAELAPLFGAQARLGRALVGHTGLLLGAVALGWVLLLVSQQHGLTAAAVAYPLLLIQLSRLPRLTFYRETRTRDPDE